MIRFKDSSPQINQIQQNAKLEEIVMKHFVIFNYINADSLKLFLENNKPKKEISREELVNKFLSNEETKKNVFDTVKDVITDLTLKHKEAGSVYYMNLHNVFMNNNGQFNVRDISINDSAISKKTLDQIEKFFTDSLMKLQNEVNSLQNSIEKVFEIKSNNFTVNQDGVEVTVKIEDFKKMFHYFIKVMLPFITDNGLIDKLLDNKWWEADDKNSMIFNGNVAKAKSNRETLNNSNSYQNVADAKRNVNNQMAAIFKNFESISTVRLPINNLEVVLSWASMFAYGDLNQMQENFPIFQLQCISSHAEFLIENYKKQNEIMKHPHCKLIVDLARLIIDQVNELNMKKKTPTRYITVEFLKKLFEMTK